MRILLIAVLSLFISATAAQADDLVVKDSPYGVKETFDRLEGIFKKKGMTVFARINHAAGHRHSGCNNHPS